MGEMFFNQIVADFGVNSSYLDKLKRFRGNSRNINNLSL